MLSVCVCVQELLRGDLTVDMLCDVGMPVFHRGMPTTHTHTHTRARINMPRPMHEHQCCKCAYLATCILRIDLACVYARLDGQSRCGHIHKH